MRNLIPPAYGLLIIVGFIIATGIGIFVIIVGGVFGAVLWTALSRAQPSTAPPPPRADREEPPPTGPSVDPTAGPELTAGLALAAHGGRLGVNALMCWHPPTSRSCSPRALLGRGGRGSARLDDRT